MPSPDVRASPNVIPSPDVMPSPEVGVLVAARATVGEGPVTSPDGQSVHWVDIMAGEVHTTELGSGKTTSVQVDTLVGAVALRTGGGYVAATREGFGTIGLEGQLHTRLALLPAGIRMNDGKCDSAGRFWAGSTAMDFAAGHGALHVLLPDWTTQVVLTGLTQPNGLGWSPDDATFYLIDSALASLTAWDFDIDSATLSNQRVLRTFTDTAGVPDGLTIDAAGDIWLAMWGGSELVQLSPSGAIKQRLALPVRQPSSCAFAGPKLDLLVVTSAAQDLELGPDTVDGSLLYVQGLNVAGRPSAQFNG